MNKGDAGKTKKQLIAELDELREKMVQLVALSELETIFKILPDTYFRMDDQGTILDFKAGRFSDLLDKPGHFLGRRIGEILPVDAAGKIMKAMEDAGKTRSLTVVEYSLVMPEGPRHYEARLLSFEHHQFLCVIRNITERKQVEEELKRHRAHLQEMVDERTIELETINRILQEEIAERKKIEAVQRESEEKYRMLFNLGNDEKYVHPLSDKGPGCFVELNDVVCKRLGYTREEMLRLSPWDIARHPYEGRPLEITRELLQKGASVFECFHITKDGIKIPVEVSSQLFHYKGISMVISITRDITIRKKAGEELKAAKEVAESASRLKSRFLANISHDIRTPLNSILGFANLILKGDIDDKSRKYLGKIINSGDGLLSLLNDILDFSKIEAGQLEVYPRTFLAEELEESIKSLFYIQFKQKGIEFHIKKHPRVPDRVYGDKWRIHQVLTNLLSNSLKFTRKGTVTLEIDYNKTTDRIQFGVKDTGIGIAKKNREDIFKPFTRLQSFGELEKAGTGIGLAICKNLVNLMGGNIQVKSRLNQGSLFTFDIPANSKKAQEGPLTASMTGEVLTDLGKKLGNRILIVDDNPVNQELIREQLKSVGFNSLLLGNNGQEAVELAVKHHPDLILMDIQMPVMDGNEAIGELRQKGCKMPVIALSAFAMREYINKSLAVGADAYITKPIDFDRFFSQISPFLKEKKGIPKFEPIITTANRENKKEGTRIKESISNRVREVFLKDAQTKLEILTKALGTGNFKKSKKEIKVIAHNYRGNAGFFGLTRLENAAEQLEQALNNEEADETLTALTQNMTEILTQIIEMNRTKK
jgi:PAS domain S-box-containing protein